MPAGFPNLHTAPLPPNQTPPPVGSAALQSAVPPPTANLQTSAPAGPGVGGAATAEGVANSVPADADPNAQQAIQQTAQTTPQQQATQPIQPGWLPGASGQALYAPGQGPVTSQVPELKLAHAPVYRTGDSCNTHGPAPMGYVGDVANRGNMAGLLSGAVLGGEKRSGDNPLGRVGDLGRFGGQFKLAADPLAKATGIRAVEQMAKKRKDRKDRVRKTAQTQAKRAILPTQMSLTGKQSLDRSAVGEGNLPFKEKPWSEYGSAAWPDTYNNPSKRKSGRAGLTTQKVPLSGAAKGFKKACEDRGVSPHLLAVYARQASGLNPAVARDLLPLTKAAMGPFVRQGLKSLWEGTKKRLPSLGKWTAPARPLASAAWQVSKPTVKRTALFAGGGAAANVGGQGAKEVYDWKVKGEPKPDFSWGKQLDRAQTGALVGGALGLGTGAAKAPAVRNATRKALGSRAARGAGVGSTVGATSDYVNWHLGGQRDDAPMSGWWQGGLIGGLLGGGTGAVQRFAKTPAGRKLTERMVGVRQPLSRSVTQRPGRPSGASKPGEGSSLSLGGRQPVPGVGPKQRGLAIGGHEPVYTIGQTVPANLRQRALDATGRAASGASSLAGTAVAGASTAGMMAHQYADRARGAVENELDAARAQVYGTEPWTGTDVGGNEVKLYPATVVGTEQTAGVPVADILYSRAAVQQQASNNRVARNQGEGGTMAQDYTARLPIHAANNAIKAEMLLRKGEITPQQAAATVAADIAALEEAGEVAAAEQTTEFVQQNLPHLLEAPAEGAPAEGAPATAEAAPAGGDAGSWMANITGAAVRTAEGMRLLTQLEQPANAPTPENLHTANTVMEAVPAFKGLDDSQKQTTAKILAAAIDPANPLRDTAIGFITRDPSFPVAAKQVGELLTQPGLEQLTQSMGHPDLIKNSLKVLGPESQATPAQKFAVMQDLGNVMGSLSKQAPQFYENAMEGEVGIINKLTVGMGIDPRNPVTNYFAQFSPSQQALLLGGAGALIFSALAGAAGQRGLAVAGLAGGLLAGGAGMFGPREYPQVEEFFADVTSGAPEGVSRRQWELLSPETQAYIKKVQQENPGMMGPDVINSLARDRYVNNPDAPQGMTPEEWKAMKQFEQQQYRQRQYDEEPTE